MYKPLNNDMINVARMIRKEGIRPFARRTEVPVSTVHKWAHHSTPDQWNLLHFAAACRHLGMDLRASVPAGKRKAPKKPRTPAIVPTT